MPVLTAGYPLPPHRCVNDEKQIKELFSVTANIQDWAVALVEELRYILCNLDAGNVSEAQSVKAEHIDTRTARIQSAQIQSLKADKIKTGVLHVTEKMTIQNGDGSIQFLPDSIVMSTPYVDENGAYHVDEEGNPVMVPRLQMGRIAGTNTFIFTINDKYGKPTLMLNDAGEAVFQGVIQTGKDAIVGHNITLGGKSEGLNSITFSGTGNDSKIINNDADKVFTISPSYSKDDLVFTEMGTYLGTDAPNNRILTQADYNRLLNRIEALEDKLKQ